MATSSGRIDEFVKDYLIYRGLSSTLRTLELELKNEKEKAFRVDKIVDQLQAYVCTYDLANLREYWTFLNSRLFARLEQRYMTSVRKLEVGLLKYYLVNAAQNNKQEKIHEFFDRMTELLQTHSEFKEWFAFPFVRSPKENSHFATYFSQQWQDTFFLSLHNFLSVILQAMRPVLLNFESEHRQLKQLQAENERLKKQILSLNEKPDIDIDPVDRDTRRLEHNHMDIVYDFSCLGEETAIQEPTSKSPRKFPFTSSPLSIVKKLDKPSQSLKKKDDQIRMTQVANKEAKVVMKGSRLLPGIARQKKAGKSTGNGQSQLQDTTANQLPDTLASQNTVESQLANQKLKRLEDARAKRKELLEGNSDRQKSKDDRPSTTEPQHMYTRSVSESAASISSGKSSPRSSHRLSSKSISETKSSSQLYESVAPGTTMDTVSPLAASAVSAMLGTGVSERAREMQAFPPQSGMQLVPSNETSHVNAPSGSQTVPSSQTTIATQLQSSSQVSEQCQQDTNRPDNSMSVETEFTDVEPLQKQHVVVEEKPFILLGQDDYCEHRSAVSYARFSNSGQYIASVDVDGVVKVWTWSPKMSTAATVMSKAAFLSLEWASKSDRWLLLGNRSGNIRLFDVKEMKSFYEATADSSFPRIIGMYSNPASPTFVCSATTGGGRSGSIGLDTGPSRDHKIGKLSIWDLKTMKTDRSLPLEPGPVCINSCSFNHNGQLLLAGGVDGSIRLYDVSKQKCVSQWSAHSLGIQQVVFSADFTSCYSLASDGVMSEWSMHKTGKKIRDLPLGAVPKIQVPEGASSTKEVPMGRLLALDSDGKYLLGCSGSGAEIYRMTKDEPGLVSFMNLKSIKSVSVTTVDWSPSMDTRICLSGYSNGVVQVSTLLSQ